MKNIEDTATLWKEAKRLYGLGLNCDGVARVLDLSPDEVVERVENEKWLSRADSEALSGARDKKRLKRIADCLTKRTFLLSKEAESAKDIKDLTAVLKDLTAVARNLQEENPEGQESETIRFVVEGDYQGD